MITQNMYKENDNVKMITLENDNIPYTWKG